MANATPSAMVKQNLNVVITLGVFALIAVTSFWWVPPLQQRLKTAISSGTNTEGDDEEHAEDSHAANSLALSEQSLRNIAYKPHTVTLGDYTRLVTYPAIVKPRPGRSLTDVPATLTGIVTKVYVLEGASVKPGDPLFDIRLTHEDLVTSQRDFLKLVAELGVHDREIKRLQSIDSGIIPASRILEVQYDRDRTQASIQAQRQGLQLHGLSIQQIDAIRDTGQLVQQLTIYVPELGEPCEQLADDFFVLIRDLAVTKGQQVIAGERLCTLADYCMLYLEGAAFEADIDKLTIAAQRGWKLQAARLTGEHEVVADDLEILRLADEVHEGNRAFHFYMLLKNELPEQNRENGSFVIWKFKPGQRLEVRAPVSKLENQIVLPASAVVEEGSTNYVFQENGGHFDRLEVHVLERDPQRVVVESDGTLFPGDVIAGAGAYQMHLDLKNKAGGGADPHAGHTH